MQKWYGWVKWMLAVWLLAGCSSLQVQNDYDPSYDFGKIHTFAVLYAKEADAALSLAQQRIAKAIEHEMWRKGYRKASRQQADLLMLFHLNVTRKRQVVTDYERVGLYPYRAWYGPTIVIPVTREVQWDESRLIVDAIDPNGNRVVWRGLAVDRLRDYETPERRIAYIQGVVGKILATFPNHKGIGH